MQLWKPKIAVILPRNHAAEPSRGNADSADAEWEVELFFHNGKDGYGANQKKCCAEALTAGANIIVMVHPDYEYDAALLPGLIRPIVEGRADAVLGSWVLGGHSARRGTTQWRDWSDRLVSQLQNATFGLRLAEYDAGYRAFRSEALEHVNLEMNSNQFLFDQEVLAQLANLRLRIAEAPVPARNCPPASPSMRQGPGYGLSILWLLLRYELHGLGLLRQRQFESRNRRHSAGPSTAGVLATKIMIPEREK